MATPTATFTSSSIRKDNADYHQLLKSYFMEIILSYVSWDSQIKKISNSLVFKSLVFQFLRSSF